MSFRYTDEDGMNSIISFEDITKHKKYPKEGDQVIATDFRGVHAGFVKSVDDDGGKGYVRIDWACKEPCHYGYFGYTLWLFTRSKNLKLFREGVEI